MTARTIAIGDVHGCLAALDALLVAIDPQEDDTLVTLGDVIDRGPHSCEVVERIIEMGDRCQVVSLMGNHEAMMLDALQDGDLDFWLTCGGMETVRSYGGKLSDIPSRHMEYLKQCSLYWESDNHFFTHANYRADIPLASQPEQTLLWEHLTFSVPGPHVSGKTAVVGHTPQRSREILDLGYLKCIDTFCIGGGWLTALEVGTGQPWQASADGQMRG